MGTRGIGKGRELSEKAGDWFGMRERVVECMGLVRLFWKEPGKVDRQKVMADHRALVLRYDNHEPRALDLILREAVAFQFFGQLSQIYPLLVDS